MVLAVSREDASKLKSKKVKTQKGSRNLYLAREGCKYSQRHGSESEKVELTIKPRACLRFYNVVYRKKFLWNCFGKCVKYRRRFLSIIYFNI